MLTNSIYLRDTRVRRYAEPLADEGFLVDIVCLASEDAQSQTKHPNIRVFPLPMTRHRREGLKHVLEWAVSTLMMLLFTSWLDIRNRYDLIHVHNMPDVLVFCAFVPRLRGCRVLLNVHDPSPEVARAKLGLAENHPMIRLQAFLEKISIMFSTHVITATPAFAKMLIKRGIPAEKITVVMNAADPRFFPLDRNMSRARQVGEAFTLLYVGTVARRYGLDVCIRALPILREEIHGIKLKVVPKIRHEGRALDDCLELARILEVSDLIEVSDPVPLEMMPDLMRQADIGIYPALQDCHMDVALSLKIPEMANVGLCIVATRLNVLEELYGETCIAFVPSGDHVAFAAKVLELYRSPELRQSLSRNALQRSASFTWDSQYRVYRELLESMLGR